MHVVVDGAGPASAPGGGASVASDWQAAMAALDAKLDALMATVRLAYLAPREGGWDKAIEWGEVSTRGAAHSQLLSRQAWDSHFCMKASPVCARYRIVMMSLGVVGGAGLTHTGRLQTE